MSDDERRFYDGDILTVRGHQYEVDSVDVMPQQDRVIQYRLSPVDNDSPPCTLEPAGEGFVAKMFFEVDPTVIE